MLPGSPGLDLSAEAFNFDEGQAEPSLINLSDAQISENLSFRYHLLAPATANGGLVIMLHGFNEKSWDKYLPWAAYLAQNLSKAVLLFPIAFHMNRAPALWSESRSMYKLSQWRKKLHPNIVCSSLSNAAISARLQLKPQRFICSGLQSYRDLIDLVEQIKNGRHPLIAREASIDFFAYSIGVFLGQVVMMTNENSYFDNSRLLAFCGGPTFNRLSPVSKFILDSEAAVSLYSCLVEHLERHIENSKFLGRHMNYAEGLNLRAMLNYKTGLSRRETQLRALAKRIYALALAQDEVVPPYEVVNTLQGSKKDIAIEVEIMDYPYPYQHENPFPVASRWEREVDMSFKRAFSRICQFLQ
jgi:hypothetical protein